MKDLALEWIAKDTDLARRVASTLSGLGGFLLLVGGIVLVARRVIEQSTAQVVGLDALLSGLPTWWIPEGLAGLAVALILVAAGRWLSASAADHERVYL